MGELEQAMHGWAVKLDEERGILEDLLTGDYFTGNKGSVRFAVRNLEGRREAAFAALGRGLPEGTAAEAGQLASLVSSYGDALEYLSDMLTIERDRSEQYIRTQVQGPMSGNFDDYYEAFGVLAKLAQAPAQDIDNLTDAYAGELGVKIGYLATYQVKLCDTLHEIAKARLALDSIVRVQVAIMRTRLYAYKLEQAFHALRLELDGDRIAIVEE